MYSDQLTYPSLSGSMSMMRCSTSWMSTHDVIGTAPFGCPGPACGRRRRRGTTCTKGAGGSAAPSVSAAAAAWVSGELCVAIVRRAGAVSIGGTRLRAHAAPHAHPQPSDSDIGDCPGTNSHCRSSPRTHTYSCVAPAPHWTTVAGLLTTGGVPAVPPHHLPPHLPRCFAKAWFVLAYQPVYATLTRELCILSGSITATVKTIGKHWIPTFQMHYISAFEWKPYKTSGMNQYQMH